MKLEINHKKIKEHTKLWKLNNILLHNECINNEIMEEIGKKNLDFSNIT